MSNADLKVSTKYGEIQATASTDPDYPGIFIEMNGEQLALVEYSSSDNRVFLRTWKQGDQYQNGDPVSNQQIYPHRFVSWEFFADLYQLPLHAYRSENELWQVLEQQHFTPMAITEDDTNIVDILDMNGGYATILGIECPDGSTVFVLLREHLKADPV